MLRSTEKGKLIQEKEVEDVRVEVATSDPTSSGWVFWQFGEDGEDWSLLTEVAIPGKEQSTEGTYMVYLRNWNNLEIDYGNDLKPGNNTMIVSEILLGLQYSQDGQKGVKMGKTRAKETN